MSEEKRMGILDRVVKALTPDEPVQKRSFASIEELPEDIRAVLPPEAQERFLRSYNDAYVDRDLNRARALASAWSDLSFMGYVQTDDGTYQLTKSARFMPLAKGEQAEERYALGIVYEPGVIDSQGDWTDLPELTKASRAFIPSLTQRSPAEELGLQLVKKALDSDGHEVTFRLDDDARDALAESLQKGQGLNDMHTDVDLPGEIVEWYQAPVDMTFGDTIVKRGTILMGVVFEEEYWAEVVKEGERTGWSLEGLGQRQPGNP
jgi:cation transport regulator ChaB